MILWKFTFREIKSRPGRATLTLLSIVIGVAAVVAVTVGTATTNRAFHDMFASVAGRAALEVTAAGDAFFDKSVVDEIAKAPGVKAAVPSVQRLTSLRFKKSKLGLYVIGIDPLADKAVRDYELEEGHFFTKKYDALLEVGFARGLGANVGDDVKLMTMQGIKTFTIVGLLKPYGVAGFKQGSVIFVPLATAAKVCSRAGSVNLVSVVLDEGADEKAVAEAVRARLPQGDAAGAPALSVRSPGERSDLSKELIEKVQRGLDFAYVTIMVLAFVTILNTFLMNVGERRRQLAVLRAIGTTRRQLIQMLLVEGLVMGVVGTLLGTAAGLGGAYLLAQSIGKVYATNMPGLRVTPAPFIAAGCVGPIVSLLAMFIPAWIAGRVSPLEGMRFVASERRGRVSFWYVSLAILAFVATGALLAASIFGYLPVSWMTVAGVLFTLAFLLLIPIILHPLAWLVSWVLNPLLRTEGRIASRQVLRRRVRTALTVGILYIAASAAISLGTNILDTVQDIHTWARKTFKGDFLVRATNQEIDSGMSAKMPETYVNELRALDGVANVDSLRNVPAAVEAPNLEDGKQRVVVCVRDFTDKGELPLDIKAGDTATLREHLAEGEVILGTVLAHRIGAKVGDDIRLEGLKKPLRVAATATVYVVGGMVVYMEGETARRLLNVDGVDVYIVNALPGMREKVYEQVKASCDDRGLLLQSFAELLERIDNMTKGVIGGLWGLLVLCLVVGAFAVANTLTMNVLEQTRELALLRVVAMTRWQVRKSILAQALTIGAIGLLTGTIGGLAGAYVMNICYAQLLGHAPQLSLHPSLVATCVLAGFIVILAAAWIPAERAARLKLLIALQYE
jgi:putative ABC transport system permease protein